MKQWSHNISAELGHASTEFLEVFEPCEGPGVCGGEGN